MSDSATPTRRPIVWSIAGNDSGGGAGLSADARVAEAFDVHLCPVVACITAQNSLAVEQITPLSAGLLDAQLGALAADLPPDAIKTGLLGDAALVAVVARWVDRLRRARPGLPLVVDPVLRASTGAAFADVALLSAYQDQLLPRATLITPNRREAQALVDHDEALALQTQPDAVVPRGAARPDHSLAQATPTRQHVPTLARALQDAGAQSVCITGGDTPDADAAGLDRLSLDWIASPQAEGWLALPRVATAHTHGSGCTFATAVAAAMARGFVAADAAVLAKMATTAALRHGHGVGDGAGPVGRAHGFHADATLMPHMSWGDDVTAFADAAAVAGEFTAPALQPGLYALLDDASRSERILQAAGDDLSALQLRIKREAHPALDDAAFVAHAQHQVALARAAIGERPITLYINDHWRIAAAAARAAVSSAASGAARFGVHLGQEDLDQLDASGRTMLRATLQSAGVALGISSHSLWELARARSLQPSYVACGPVWPTLTKAMPWRAQGLDNLAWWQAMAGTAVVAIGGVLQPEQLRACAEIGVTAVCLVRALSDAALADWPDWRAAWQAGRAGAATAPMRPYSGWPHASLVQA